ncbi:MAG: A/G-specific adenine glycosylase [Desulfohalobiaceae bacterium]
MSHKTAQMMDKQSICRSLVNWFSQSKRDLPWRREPTPYRVWISEIMLQQTQIERAIPFFTTWMQRLPTVQDTAEADRETLFKLWEGLGYYRRVINIHRTARILKEKHGNSLPVDHPLLLTLPGIGPYTAGAIMSLAFNKPYPAVDANVQRLLCRVLDIGEPVTKTTVQKRLHHAAAALILPEHAREVNQALMECGALICMPRSPRCEQCPMSQACLARRRGVVEQRPLKAKPRKMTHLETVVGILVREGRILVQKRPETGLMPGLWEFPGGKLQQGETPQKGLQREIQEELGIDVQVGEILATVRHSYTSFRVRLQAYFCTPVSNKEQLRPQAAEEVYWAAPHELPGFSFPAANRRLVTLLARLDPGELNKRLPQQLI